MEEVPLAPLILALGVQVGYRTRWFNLQPRKAVLHLAALALALNPLQVHGVCCSPLMPEKMSFISALMTGGQLGTS